MYHLGYLVGRIFKWCLILFGIIFVLWLCWVLLGGFAVGLLLGCF